MISELLELRTLRRNGKLPPGELEALREAKLRAVIRHAYERVPYYQTLFRSAGLSPADIRTVQDLTLLPVTTKEDLRAAGPAQITARGFDPASGVTVHTSGSTGKPFTVYLTRKDLRTRQLVEFRTMLSMGMRPRDVLAVLGPERGRPPRLHDRLGLYRGHVISGSLPVKEQINRLRQLQPTVLWAYPTQLRALLNEVNYRLSEIVRPRALITSAQRLDEVLKARVLADLDVELFNFYGAVEGGRIAWECQGHRGLHVNADQVILECLEDERPAKPGKSGIAVITSLNPLAMPLIRYRLGDVCEGLNDGCSCGSSFPLISAPSGREWDTFKLPSGSLRSPGGCDFVLRSLAGIDQYRMIQETVDHFVLQLASRTGFTEASLEGLRARLLEYLGEPVRLDIEVVEFIRDEALKFKPFISKLPRTEA